jgi:hypothetical protein
MVLNEEREYVFMVWCYVKHSNNFAFDDVFDSVITVLNLLFPSACAVISLCLTQHIVLKIISFTVTVYVYFTVESTTMKLEH